MRYLLVYIVVVCFLACISKNNVEIGLSYRCFVSNDTMYLTIENKSSKILYIPERYMGTYKIGGDTIYLLSIDRPEFNTDSFYVYSKILPFQFYTVEAIPNYIPDSIIIEKRQTYYFNQFIPPAFHELKPNSNLNLLVIFDIPKDCHIVKASYYEKPFEGNRHEKNDTSDIFNKFLEFEKNNTKYITTKAITIYK